MKRLKFAATLTLCLSATALVAGCGLDPGASSEPAWKAWGLERGAGAGAD